MIVGRDFDAASMSRDDAVADGEAEAGARAGGLGGKERIEDVRAVFGGDACSVVRKFDQ